MNLAEPGPRLSRWPHVHLSFVVVAVSTVLTPSCFEPERPLQHLLHSYKQFQAPFLDRFGSGIAVTRPDSGVTRNTPGELLNEPIEFGIALPLGSAVRLLESLPRIANTRSRDSRVDDSQVFALPDTLKGSVAFLAELAAIRGSVPKRPRSPLPGHSAPPS